MQTVAASAIKLQQALAFLRNDLSLTTWPSNTYLLRNSGAIATALLFCVVVVFLLNLRGSR
jgi:preprotein translocase subunit SecE